MSSRTNELYLPISGRSVCVVVVVVDNSSIWSY